MATKVSPGALLVKLGLAFALALQLASGWAVIPATVVLWVALVVAVGLIDDFFDLRAQAGKSGIEPAPEAPPVDGTRPRLPWLSAPLRADALAPREAGGDGWCRHVFDLSAFYNERWPRDGICSSTDLFLREGDVLLLRFHPDPADGEPPAHWTVDLVPR